MTTKKFYLVFTALLTLSVGSIGWYLAGGVKNYLPTVKTLQPSKAAAPSESHLTAPIKVTEIAETPKTKNARIMADYERKVAKSSALSAAYESGGFVSEQKVQMDQWQGEYMQFLKSLGLSDAVSTKVFQKLKITEATALKNVMAKSGMGREALNLTAIDDEVSRMVADLRTTVGTDNYDKIKYWENTRQERERAQAFEAELQGHAMTLTADQRAAIVDALHQAYHGNAAFNLKLPFIPLSDKLSYIEDVKQMLTPALDGSTVDLFGQFLRKVAESP